MPTEIQPFSGLARGLQAGFGGAVVTNLEDFKYWNAPTSFDNRWHHAVQSYTGVMAEVARRLPPSPRILDVGCGPVCLARLLPLGQKTYLDPLMPWFLYRFAGKLPPDGERLAARAEDIPKPDGAFDCVVCFDMLDRVSDPGRCLEEMRRVLAPGGLLVLSLTLRGRLSRWSARLAMGELLDLLRPRFGVDEQWQIGSGSLLREEWVFLARPLRLAKQNTPLAIHEFDVVN